MKSRVIALALILFILSATVGLANIVPKGLMWQKQEIAKAVETKVNRALKTYIRESDYFIDILVNLKEPEKPDFNKKDDKKGKIRISDSKADKLPEDYVLFSKLGLEAPLVQDFEESSSAGGKKALPYFEQLWEYNQAIDAYSVISSMEVYLQISDTIGENIREDIKKTLDNLHVDINGVKPRFIITYSKLGASYNTNELPIKLSEKLELLSRYSTMLGLLMAVALAGLVAFFLLRKYLESMKEIHSAAPASSETGKNEDKEKDLGTAPALGGDEEGGVPTGVERFKLYLKNSPKEAGLLVKNWIKINEKDSNCALNLLLVALENEELVNLFSYISDEERNSWGSLLSEEFSERELSVADTLISMTIVSNILSPHFITDEEVCDILLNLETEDAARFVEQEGEFSGILLNALNPKLISKIINLLPQEVATSAISRSMKQDKNIDASSLSAFKQKLKDYQSVESKSPFVHKLLELIPMSSRKIEGELYRTLAEYNYPKRSFTKLVYSCLPSELILRLPVNFILNSLQNYPIEKKTHLIFVLDGEYKKHIQAVFAPEGSKAKDMIDFEMDVIKEDALLQDEIKSKENEIWSDFIQSIRKYIVDNPESKIAIAPACEEWISEIYTGVNFSKQKPDLKVA